MSTHAIPYDWGEARDMMRQASLNMREAETRVRDAYKQHAAAERAYRMALAEKILKLKAEGLAWTVCQDVARGDPHVADLRFNRDVAEGVKEAAVSAQWRFTADRRELEQLVTWSMRVAPDGQMPEPTVDRVRGLTNHIGRGTAA